MSKRYSIDEIKQWSKGGQAISPAVVIDLIEDNMTFRKFILQAIDLLTDDPILLRRIDLSGLEDWKERAEDLLKETR